VVSLLIDDCDCCFMQSLTNVRKAASVKPSAFPVFLHVEPAVWLWDFRGDAVFFWWAYASAWPPDVAWVWCIFRGLNESPAVELDACTERAPSASRHAGRITRFIGCSTVRQAFLGLKRI